MWALCLAAFLIKPLMTSSRFSFLNSLGFSAYTVIPSANTVLLLSNLFLSFSVYSLANVAVIFLIFTSYIRKVPVTLHPHWRLYYTFKNFSASPVSPCGFSLHFLSFFNFLKDFI